jgi:cysteine-rich repeat protein
MTPNRTTLSRTLRRITWGALASLLLPALASAAVPTTVLLEGTLQATGGGPAADGKYLLNLAIYPDAQGGQAAWSEQGAEASVQGGLFSLAMGAKVPLKPELLATLAKAYLGIAVQPDPELPRVPVHTVLYALRAGVATGIDCSGCVQTAHLDPQVFAPYAKSADLAAYAKTATLAKVATSGAFADLSGGPDLSGYAQTASLATVATSGTYADLEGLPTLAKLGIACGTGLVVRGLKADGSYDCVQAMDPTALPKDALDEVSNGLLTNQFNEVAASTKLVPIPDNSPVGISDVIDVPDFGIAQTFTVAAEIANSDTGNLRVTLIDPAGTKFVLWDKTAKGTQVKTSWPNPTKTVSGDLTTWIGKNPKGKWYLEVVDVAFLNNGFDGALKGWSLNIGVMSSAKVGLAGLLKLQNAAEAPLPCGPTLAGSLYFDTVAKAVRYCDGAAWRNLADTCGNGILDATEQCDDGNNTDGDGCSATCQTVCGDGKLLGKEECDDGNTKDGDGCSAACIASVGLLKAKPGTSCAAILAAWTSAGWTAKDGKYWLDPNLGDPADAFQATCDMTQKGGGWTKVSEFAETYYDNLSERSKIPYKEVLILEWDHTAATPVYSNFVVQHTCYNSAKTGFQVANTSANCDSGYQVRVGGTGGSCGDAEDGCFGLYYGDLAVGGGCNWNCSAGAVKIWGKGYACNSCRCRNAPYTTIEGCGNGAAWGNKRFWTYVR